MGSRTTRSIFAVALCSGVAMVGASIHGLLGVDTELQRSVLAAQQTIEREPDSVRVIDRGDCAPPPYKHRI
jgi:hypothetical protein